MNMDLLGKTILITGAAGGLGSAIALECANNGAELVLLDRNRQALGQLSDRISEEGSSLPGLYPLNLATTGVDEFNELAATIGSEFGRLDALIHCALEFQGLQPLDQVRPQDWLQSMQVNVNAPWLLSCALLPLLLQSENGRLIFLLDDLDKVADAFWGAYGTSKAALHGLVRQFDAALSHTAVSVRGIIPGPMRTGFRAKIYQAENPMEQPDPIIVAGKIVSMLKEAPSDGDLIVDFSH